MKLFIWAIASCLQMILVKSEEQCNIYGAMVERPGRECICDQLGVVRCKPRLGGRFLVCVLDMSQLGSNVNELFGKINEQKRIYREFVAGGAKVEKEEKEEKIDESFDPPEFTMTSRPSIGGGIGNDDVGFGRADDAGGGDGGKDGDEEIFRRLKHPAKKPHGKRLHQAQTSPNARIRSMRPSRKNKAYKNSTQSRATKPSSPHPRGSHKVIKNSTKGKMGHRKHMKEKEPK